MFNPISARVPLSALEVSPLNARAHDDGQDDAEIGNLADSIVAVGLLHPLVVHELGQGKYGVIAGRRRLLALRMAFEDGDIEAEVPVTIVAGDESDLAQASVAENLQRAMMTDLDLFKSIQRILADGKQATDEMLAQAFGTSVSRVKRLVRLSHVHPEIMAAFEAQQISRAELELFAKSPDPDEQLRVWEAYQNDEIGQWQIAAALGFGDKDDAARLALVSADAYKAAGGKLEEDLFGAPEDARVLDHDVLEKLVNEAIEARKAEIVKLYPDREITFTFEAPKDSSGYADYALQARPVYPDEVDQAIDAEDEKIEAILEALGAISGERYWPYHATDLAEGLPADHGIEGDKVQEWEAEIGKLCAALDAKAELEKTPKVLPEKATVCVLSIRRNQIDADWYFPDRASAGREERQSSSSNPAASKPKPGDEDFDPDDPALTQKAVDHIKAMRSNMAARYVAGDAPRHAEAAGRAHKALIFTMAWKQLHPYDNKGELGLVHSFAGATYENPGTELAHQPMPEVPGLDNEDALEGWFAFEDQATPEQIDRLAAWLFARKLDPGKSHEPNVATDVLRGLSHDPDARSCAQADLDETFFKLFPKKVLAAFAKLVNAKAEKEVLELKGDGPVAYMVKLHAEPKGKAEKWLPSFLRWPAP